LFEQYLKSGKAGKFQNGDLIVIRDEGATLDRVHLALREAILGAQPGDRVYIFISARGIARPGALDGYLGASDLVESKPQSTGVSVSDLKDMMQNSKAQRIFFFADVCRDPPTDNIENRINIRLETLGTVPKVSGFLGSDRQRLSLEKADLQYAQQRGFGVFGYSLVTGLTGGSGSALFEYLRREMASQTNSRQTPTILGKSTDFPNLGAGVAEQRKQGGLLVAALRWTPGLFRFQVRQQTPDDVLRDLAASSPPTEPESLAQKARDLKNSLPPEDWITLRDGVIATLAARGQNLIAEYGVSDMLPDDPLRVRKGNRGFSVAAREFQSALSLLPDEELYRAYRQDLESRRLLCSGLDQIYQDQVVPARDDLRQAETSLRRPLPEVYNALGITFLEEGKDYDSAIRYFQLAQRYAPAWPYPRHNLALTYAEKGDYSSAERTYRDAIAIAPEQPYLYYNLGLLLQRSNQTGPARRAYEEALESLTKQATTYSLRSAEWMRELPEKAQIARQRAEGFAKAKAIVENALGALMASRHNPEAAANYYEQAIDADSMLCATRQNLAVLKQTQPGRKWPGTAGDPQALLEENLLVCADFHPSRIRLSMIYLGQGDLVRARTGFETVLAQVPGNVEAKKGLAEVLMRQKQFAPAIALWNGLIDTELKQQESAATGKPNREALANPSLYEGLGDAYAASSDSRACAAYRTALKALKGSVYDGDRNQLRRKAQSCAN
jgi:tetratricopeptide (TPR) repeat protein